MANKIQIENLEDLIKDTIGGKLLMQEVSLLLPEGENYASVLYKVDFKVNKGGQDHEFHAVAKCISPNPVIQELNIKVTVKLEIAWYKTVIPTLIQFQKDHGVENPIDFFQKVYGTRLSLNPKSEEVDSDAVILTENLKYLGYKNVPRREGFDLLTTYAILKKLATFHAVPLAIRSQQPDTFNTNIRPYLTAWTQNQDMDNDFIKGIFTVYQHIPKCQSVMDKIRETINKSVVFQKREVREPWVTAAHMDFWSNNIMTTGGENPKIIILDLQCPGFASPAADLAIFLLTSVTQNVISEKLDSLLKFYHEEFIRNLKELNVSVDEFSFESFLNEFKTEIKAGALAHVLGHIAVVFSEGTFSTTDENFAADEFSSRISVNENHIKKFEWITFEAKKRNWI